MRRVVVLGSSGSGKSTFARRLSAATGLPIISLDALFWRPGWTPSEPAAFRARVIEAMRSPGWIMDGNYTSATGDLRAPVADAAFFLDLPRLACMAGVVGRVARHFGRVRPEMAQGCPERIDVAFLRYVWDYPETQRPKVLAWLGTLSRGARVHHFKSRREADAYLDARAGAPAPFA